MRPTRRSAGRPRKSFRSALTTISSKAPYQRWAELSVAQMYRLRKSLPYRQRRVVYRPTRPTKVAIGERRRPEAGGRPGYLRVDTVHQGDRDGVQGVYHITAVDEVTQWQVVGGTEQIIQAYIHTQLK